MSKNKCIFCAIAEGNDPNTTILYKNDKIVVFRDIRPAAPHHYLVIPIEHIRDARTLTHQHIDLVNEMLEAGKNVLKENGGAIEEAKIGFHLPPLLWVPHLHLHILAPVAQMGFLSRMVYKDDSYWFHTVDTVLTRLKAMESKSENTACIE